MHQYLWTLPPSPLLCLWRDCVVLSVMSCAGAAFLFSLQIQLMMLVMLKCLLQTVLAFSNQYLFFCRVPTYQSFSLLDYAINILISCRDAAELGTTYVRHWCSCNLRPPILRPRYFKLALNHLYCSEYWIRQRSEECECLFYCAIHEWYAPETKWNWRLRLRN